MQSVVTFVFVIFTIVDASSVLEDGDIERYVTNGSARDSNSDVLLVVIMCILFCAAVRHANDFYYGGAVTLVREGIWGGRFRHRDEKKYLSHIEKDFEDMFTQLREKEDSRVARSLETSSIEVDCDSD